MKHVPHNSALTLTEYRGVEADRVTSALADLVAGREAWPPAPTDDAVRVVTASLHAHVVGAIATRVDEGGTLHVLDVIETTHGDEDVLAALIDAAIDATDMPWVRVETARTSPVLPHLLQTGWDPVAREGRRESLLLTGASVA